METIKSLISSCVLVGRLELGLLLKSPWIIVSHDDTVNHETDPLLIETV